MARPDKAAPVKPGKVTQDKPTAPARRNAAGYEVDAWGLPLVGPVRLSLLEALGLPDPEVDADSWGDRVVEEGDAAWRAALGLASIVPAMTADMPEPVTEPAEEDKKDG